MRAIDIANCFITIENYNEEADITNLKLNKLLYYAYGHYLAMYKKPLFNEKIFAWKFGPVVKEIYSIFKENDKNNIERTSDEFDINSIPRDILLFLIEIQNQYGIYSASKLVNMTHQNGTPWSKTKLNDVISDSIIYDYFNDNRNLKTIDDILEKVETIGYIDEKGRTILPSELDDGEDYSEYE